MKDVRGALLERLIDDAGLFPPASLSMADALAADAAARAGPHGSVVGRFLCPASRLPELTGTLPAEVDRLALGVVLDAGIELASVIGHVDRRLVLETVEARPLALDADHLRRNLDIVTAPVTFFVEAPDSTDAASVAEAVRVAAAVGAGVKLRCGGPTADLVPPTPVVAAFLAATVAAGVPFKLTAGLHHPLHHVDATTRSPAHGFLNLAVATVLAVAGAGVDLGAVVSETDPGAFALGADGVGWRGHRAGLAAVEATRTGALRAFGSCSLDEPVADLVALGMLV